MSHKEIITSNYHFIFPIFLVIFLTVGVFFVVEQSHNQTKPETLGATTNCAVSQQQLATKIQEQQLLDLINSYRNVMGVSQLTWDPTLKQAAAWLSLDMFAQNTLSHTDSLGRTADIRLSNCGYSITKGYGEALAEGSTSAKLIFNAWQSNSADNQILLNKNYTAAGIDMEGSSGTKIFWTLDLGVTSSTSPTITGTTTLPTNAVSSAPSEPSQPIEPSATPEPVAADMVISVAVKINGIGQGGNTSPKHLTRKITANVYGVGPTPATTGTGFLTYDGRNYFTGTIHLGELAQGAYIVKLGSDNTLQVIAKPEFQNLVIGKTNAIPSVTLYQGDLDGNNVLDINDYNLALPCFQNKTCSDLPIDFNDDGVINVLDYNLFLQSFEVLHGD
jgi:uncharacterized protein YkwD